MVFDDFSLQRLHLPRPRVPFLRHPRSRLPLKKFHFGYFTPRLCLASVPFDVRPQ